MLSAYMRRLRLSGSTGTRQNASWYRRRVSRRDEEFWGFD